MKRLLLWGICLGSLSLLSVHCVEAREITNRAVTLGGGTHLQSVWVWYYPEAMAKPVLVKSLGKLSTEKRLVFPGGVHRFRIRAVAVGEHDNRLNIVWMRIVFRDAEGNLYQLPMSRWGAPGGVKDVFFRVPHEFAPGTIECRVDLLAGNPKDYHGRMIVDTTGFMMLGRSDL